MTMSNRVHIKNDELLMWDLSLIQEAIIRTKVCFYIPLQYIYIQYRVIKGLSSKIIHLN